MDKEPSPFICSEKGANRIGYEGRHLWCISVPLRKRGLFVGVCWRVGAPKAQPEEQWAGAAHAQRRRTPGRRSAACRFRPRQPETTPHTRARWA